MCSRPVFLSLFPFLVFLVLLPLQAQQSTNAPSAAPDKTATNGATGAPTGNLALTIDARKRFMANDYEGSLKEVQQVLSSDPKNYEATTLRGVIYTQKKQWSLAQADFNTALQIKPNDDLAKYNLAEIDFMQQHYDMARAQFVTLLTDPELTDIITYKIFLCDLFGGHEDVAAKELDVMNQKAENPSYFFSNAAWSLYHKKVEDARSWLTSAFHIYPASKNNYYATTLQELGYLPLPPPPAAN